MAVMRTSLAAFVLIVAAGALASSASAQTVTIELTSIQTEVQQHDTAPQGQANKGDSIDFRDLLLNSKPQFGKKTGKPVAYDVGKLVYTSKTAQRMTGVAIFPKIGTITFAGPFYTGKDGTTLIPITGGTGLFKGATGVLKIGTGQTKTRNTYVITVPRKITIGGSTPIA
jgi:hypothetical protein